MAEGWEDEGSDLLLRAGMEYEEAEMNTTRQGAGKGKKETWDPWDGTHAMQRNRNRRERKEQGTRDPGGAPDGCNNPSTNPNPNQSKEDSDGNPNPEGPMVPPPIPPTPPSRASSEVGDVDGDGDDVVFPVLVNMAQ